MNNTKTSDDKTQEGPSGSGTIHGYTFEIRTTFEPFEIGDVMVTGEWKTVHHVSVRDCGVPARSYAFEPGMDYFGLVSLVVAQALRWQFMAVIDAQRITSLCIETRIVKHQIKYKLSCEQVETMYEINGRHMPIVKESEKL